MEPIPNCSSPITTIHKWDFNSPFASHFGGVWKRLIRSVRKVMYLLLYVIHLDDEALQIVFCEVESILNSRPITTVSDDGNDLDVRTSNELLLLRPNKSLPCEVFDSNNTYAVVDGDKYSIWLFCSGVGGRLNIYTHYRSEINGNPHPET